MAKIKKSFETVCDFMLRDQFPESCSRKLYVYLKLKPFKNLDEIAKGADLFAGECCGVVRCVNQVQRDNKSAMQS